MSEIFVSVFLVQSTTNKRQILEWRELIISRIRIFIPHWLLLSVASGAVVEVVFFVCIIILIVFTIGCACTCSYRLVIILSLSNDMN